MRFVSPALKNIVFPVLSRSGYLRYQAGAGPAVVTYHGVFPSGYQIRNHALDGNLVHADRLRRQLRLLQERYQVITPQDFLHWVAADGSEGKGMLPPRSILLTCDDALRNTQTEMVPILQEFGVSALFFATGASAEETPSMLWYEELYLMLLDAKQPVNLSIPGAGVRVGPIKAGELHTGWWNLVERLSAFDREPRGRLLCQIREQLRLPDDWRDRIVEDAVLAARFLTLDRNGLRKMADAGMAIGAHSLSHPILAKAPREMAWREICEGRSVLEKVLEQTVWAFGYPFGTAATVTKRDLGLAEDAGFRCAFMNTGGGFGAQINRFAVPRVHVTADMSLGEFEAHLSGFFRSLRQRLRGDEELGAVAGD